MLISEKKLEYKIPITKFEEENKICICEFTIGKHGKQKDTKFKVNKIVFKLCQGNEIKPKGLTLPQCCTISVKINYSETNKL